MPGASFTARRIYNGVLWLALVWVCWNLFTVYLTLEGQKGYRIEAAVYLLAFLLLPSAVRRPDELPQTLVLNRWLILALGGFGLAALLFTYWPVVSLPFLSDDYVFIGQHQRTTHSEGAPQFFRPFFVTVFNVLLDLGRGSPAVFHIASLAVHVSAALLVYRLSYRVLRVNGAAILCFVVFLLNPVQLEAVLWASGLQELLWVFCMLGALTLYTEQQRLSPLALASTLAAVALALLSKETAVSAVLLLPAADGWFFRWQRGRLMWICYGCLVVGLFAYAIVRSQVVPADPTFLATPDRYFVKQLLALPYGFFVHPWSAGAIRPPNLVLLASGLAAVLLVFLTTVRRRGALMLVGAFLVLASTLPVFTYFYVAPDLRHARYLYFPWFGWAVIVSAGCASLFRQPWRFVLATMVVGVASTVSLSINLRPWRTAGELVVALERRLRSGESLEAVVDAWMRDPATQVVMRDGVPVEHRGVWLFQNGYVEFRRMALQRADVDFDSPRQP